MQIWLAEDPAMAEGVHVYFSGTLMATAETPERARAIVARWNATREAYLHAMCAGRMLPTPEQYEAGRQLATATLREALDT